MAVYVDSAGVHSLWQPPTTGFPVLYVYMGGPSGPSILYPEFFTAFVGTNELQDGIEVPPAGVLVF